MWQLFVENAPNRSRREAIMYAFVAWRASVTRLLPSHQLWVDGGFVTHKPEAPNDLDVAIMLRGDDLNKFTSPEQAEFERLLTYTDPTSKRRIQPMAGLIDGHYGVRGNPDSTTYWYDWWQRVKGDDSARKGFLVVRPND